MSGIDALIKVMSELAGPFFSPPGEAIMRIQQHGKKALTQSIRLISNFQPPQLEK